MPQRGRLRPRVGLARTRAGHRIRDRRGAGVARGERREPVLRAEGRRHRAVVHLVVDHGAGVGVGADHEGGHARPEPVEGEAHLARTAVVGRRRARRGDVVENAAVLVEGDHQRRVDRVRPRRRRARADRVVDVLQQLFAGAHVGVGAVVDLDRGAVVEGELSVAQFTPRRVHVVVVEDHARLDERIRGQVPRGGVGVELRHVAEVRLPVLLERGGVDEPGERDELGGVVIHAPRNARLFETREDRGGCRCLQPLLVRAVGVVHDEPVRGRRVEERAVAVRLRGDGAEPAVVDGELAGEGREHRQHLGAEPAHRDAVLGFGGFAVQRRAVGGDVVAHEAAVGGRRGGRRRVRGRMHDVEQLRVHVRVRLARVGLRLLHDAVGRARVDVRLDPRAVGGVVGEIALRDPVELGGGLLVRRVKPAQDVVEAAVLEHQHHDVVEAGLGALGQRRELGRMDCARRVRRDRIPRTDGPARRGDPGDPDPGAAQELPPARAFVVRGHLRSLRARQQTHGCPAPPRQAGCGASIAAVQPRINRTGSSCCPCRRP